MAEERMLMIDPLDYTNKYPTGKTTPQQRSDIEYCRERHKRLATEIKSARENGQNKPILVNRVDYVIQELSKQMNVPILYKCEALSRKFEVSFLVPYEKDEPVCHNKRCRIPGTKDYEEKIKKCSGCLSVWYCSEFCQNRDWKHHKNACKTRSQGLEKSNKLKT
jgi:hypothetical protein